MLRRLATATTAALLVAIGTALPAAAHERLLSADPEQGVALDTAPTTVTLTFSGEVEATDESIRITGRDGTDWAVSDVTPSGTKISATVKAQGQPGKQVLAYRVKSPDGHTVTGTYSFDVAAFAPTTTTPPPTTTATTTAATTTAATAQPTSTVPPVAETAAPDEGGPGAWLWIVIGAVVLAALGGGAVALRRKKA